MGRVVQIRFNGATAMKPWKSANAEHTDVLHSMLQWGHGDEAVEEVGHLLCSCVRKQLASMGPRR